MLKKSFRRIREFFISPTGTVVAFFLAVVLILTGTVGTARAALTYYSETYASRVQMYDIGVTLMENGADVSWRNYNHESDGSWNENTGVLLEHMLDTGDGQEKESLKLGKAYPEELAVRNSGTINQYVRVNIYKYWVDAEGNKLTDLSPELIDLHLVNLGDCWLLDEEASTPERTVLYYNRLLYAEENADGASKQSVTEPFSDTLTVSGMVATKVTQEEKTEGGYTTITTKYDYNGVQFCLEAEVDAVQEHNAEDAILSAWGREVTVAGSVLSLK